MGPSGLRTAHFSREFWAHASGKIFEIEVLCSSVRCNLVHCRRLNLANASIPYWTCNAEILPQVWLWSKW